MTAGAPELHGYEQPARRCCLVADAGAGRATIARRLTLAARPTRERGPRRRALPQLAVEQQRGRMADTSDVREGRATSRTHGSRHRRIRSIGGEDDADLPW